jgi:large subunit ribosomal protein L3
VKRDFSDGYTALQVGAGTRKLKNTSVPLQGHFALADVPPKAVLREFRVTRDALVDPGTVLDVRHFRVGQLVDVAGISKGKGFAGVMKRWGFAGGPASHGASRVHRSAGSTGQRQDPGRVFPGKKMAGHMGASRVTVKNLVVYRLFTDLNVLLVVGAVPGPKGGWLEVRDAKNKPLQRVPPFPTATADTPVDRQLVALFRQPLQVEGEQ